MIRRGTVKVLAKPRGLPDAEVSVATHANDDGERIERVVMVYVKAITHGVVADVVARLALAPDYAEEVARAILANVQTARAFAPEPYVDGATYRCICSWVGGDPDVIKGGCFCPACWAQDRTRVAVHTSKAERERKVQP